MKLALITVCALIIFSTNVLAAVAPIYNDMGYFLTQSIYGNPKHEFTINFEAIYADADDGYTMTFPVVFNYGITNRLTVNGAFIPYRRSYNHELGLRQGRGNTILSGQYTFYDIHQTNNNLAILFNFLSQLLILIKTSIEVFYFINPLSSMLTRCLTKVGTVNISHSKVSVLCNELKTQSIPVIVLH